MDMHANTVTVKPLLFGMPLPVVVSGVGSRTVAATVHCGRDRVTGGLRVSYVLSSIYYLTSFAHFLLYFGSMLLRCFRQSVIPFCVPCLSHDELRASKMRYPVQL